MMATTAIDEELAQIREERDAYFSLILRLACSDSRTRNRILNGIKQKYAERPPGRPKRHTAESDAEYLNSFELIKAEASRIAERKLSDDEILLMTQIHGLDLQKKRRSLVNSRDFRAWRKTMKNRLGMARKSRKLGKFG